jgi:signal transduction histidine kinase
VTAKEEQVFFSIKNVSARSLALENSNAGDLTERFTRGDSSRTTEGSGLGLSIAKNLTLLMGGEFSITVDGDLFIATIVFPKYKGE